MSSVYPRKIRKAIHELVKANLDFDTLCTKHAHNLIKHNIFLNLPAKYYDFAKNLDINNILAFDKNVIQLNDLKKLISLLPKIPKCFMDVVIQYKKYLLLDATVVDKLIVSNMITLSEIRGVLENNIKTSVEIAVLNTDLIIPGTYFSLEDIRHVLDRTDVNNIKNLYKRIDTSIDNVMYMEEHFYIPPTHSSLYQIVDVCKIMRLINKYPEDDVIYYVNGSVKASKEFLQGMIHFIKKRLPELSPCINKWLATQLSAEKLRSEFGMYFYVLFDWLDVPLYIDKYVLVNLSKDECRFICRHINIYREKSELFVNIFRWHLYYCDNMYPQKVFDVAMPEKLKADHSLITDTFKYLDNTQNMLVLLNDFKHNYALAKHILQCNVSDVVKLEAFYLLKKQTTCTDSCNCLDLGTLYTIIVNLRYNPAQQVMYGNKLLGHFSNAMGVDGNKLQPPMTSDVGLLSLANTMCSMACQGIINIRFLETDFLWSPLMYLLDDSPRVNFSKLMKAIKNISEENVCCRIGSNKLEHINNLDVYNIFDYDRIRLYGITFIKKVILVNVVFEYIFTILVIRYQRSQYNYCQFLKLLIQQCLNGFGVPIYLSKKIYISETNICFELGKMTNTNNIIPFKIYNVVIKLLVVIFSNLNGIGKRPSRVGIRKNKVKI